MFGGHSSDTKTEHIHVCAFISIWNIDIIIIITIILLLFRNTFCLESISEFNELLENDHWSRSALSDIEFRLIFSMDKFRKIK